MSTTRPRYQITETPEVAQALDRAAQRWPGEPRSKLLRRLIIDARRSAFRGSPYDDGELLRLAELRASSGLKLPDCCVPDVAIHHQASLATFDDTLAAAARTRSVPASTNGAANPIRPALLDIMSLIGL